MSIKAKDGTPLSDYEIENLFMRDSLDRYVLSLPGRGA